MGWSDEAMASELKFMNKTLKSIDESLKVLAGRKETVSVQEYVEEKAGMLPKGYPTNSR